MFLEISIGKSKLTFYRQNMYVFPGIGLGSILCKAANISQEMVRILTTFLDVKFCV